MDLSAVHHRFLNPHHHQEVDSETLDSIIASSKQQAAAAAAQEKEKDSSSNPNSKPRPADNEAQKCPRCESTNTKFCYYNNYSLSQPRYFCKSCRRYWTKGGTLRNVPVGGGCRKSAKRPSSPSSILIKRPHTYETTTASNPAPLFYAGGGLDHPLHHLQGNGNNAADCDGNLLPNPHAFAFLDSLRHNTGLFHSLGYGAGAEEGLAGNVPFADVAGGGGGGIGNAAATTAMKQEGGGNDGRALWGFPWQVMNYGDQIGAASDVESIRGSWNGLIGNSAWQGLVNSPALI